MTSNNTYTARLAPVPSLDETGTVVWGWKADLTESGTDENTTLSGGGFDSASGALNAGTKALRALVRAYGEVDVYSVDLYAPEPVEETPEQNKDAGEVADAINNAPAEPDAPNDGGVTEPPAAPAVGDPS
jgi:hypothetical protein